ncbi:large ribosomal subunit protein eL36-like [Drosophila nasuta]|uniref:large ribosomal subunit protein eL36-like n=1 Tax=Drosophila nasuta TaxID=42062 RepID=UPI00295F2BD1|nr:large ribosomal subunit protein eL36-like [Drosophila nasuta]
MNNKKFKGHWASLFKCIQSRSIKLRQPYQKRVLDLLKMSKQKRALQFLKRHLLTQIRKSHISGILAKIRKRMAQCKQLLKELNVDQEPN